MTASPVGWGRFGFWGCAPPTSRVCALLAAWLLCAATAPSAYAGCDPGCDATVDADGDCYGSHADCIGPDCDDTNSAVNPGANELCNGADDDCDGTTDEGFLLLPDDSIPVYGFESRGVCTDGTTPCDLRFPLPPGCMSCLPDSHNFNQVVQACVEAGVPTGEGCDNGDPDAPGSMALGDECAGGGECIPIPVGLGEPCLEGNGVCRRIGTVVCAGDGLSAVCSAVPGDPPVENEGAGTSPETDPLCFDGLDNDCDGEVDHEDSHCQTEERCDGFDNNNNGQIDEGLGVGDECDVGPTGTPCANTGLLICDATGGVKCSVNAHPPGESPERSCGDGIDNDCDGDTDCDDPDCTLPAEVCDGMDNDCDGEVDEGFAGLNTPCKVGVGACQREGLTVCTPDGMGTTCSAQPAASSPERQTAGNACADGIDNDCDGLVDLEEPECRASELTVTCELESICRNCVGWYRISFEVLGATGETELDAHLLALDENGEVLANLPVRNGDNAKLGALANAQDPECLVAETIGGVHRMFAPVPLLRVVVRDEQGKAEAFCSNTPYLEVREPGGSVVSTASGDEIRVLGAIPGVDPKTLKVLMDCVDIIPLVVPNPATDLPGGPFSATIMVNGKTVDIIDLIVDAAVGEQSSNTVSMTIVGAGCGGHALRLEGQRAPDALTEPIPTWCHLDDLRDNGDWSVFDLQVTAPIDGQIIDNAGLRPASINVQGEVCHGLDIFQVLVQGTPVALSTPVVEELPGGACAGDSKKVTLSFDDDLPVTDIAAVFAGAQGTLGSFDPGPNKLVAQATDLFGNTTHDLVPFVVGPAIATPAQVTAAMQSVIASHDPNTIHKAFTLVLNDTAILENGNSALREFFDQFAEEFGLNLAHCLTQPREFCCNKELEMPWWTPNVDVTFCTTPLLAQVSGDDPDCPGDPVCQFANTFDFTVTPNDGFLTLTLVIPMFRLRATGHGEECTGGCGFFCIARTKVDADVTMNIPDIRLEIDITEENILMQDGTFTLRFTPVDEDTITVDGLTGDEIETGCGLFSLGTILDVLTLGIIAIHRELFDALQKILGFIVDKKGIDLCPFVKDDLGKDGMKEKSDDVEVCREDLGPKFDSNLTSTLEAVEITTEGIALSIAATIAPTTVDPNSDPIGGTLMTDAPLLLPNHPGLRSISMAIADDFWNQLFAGMTQSGKLRAQFTRVFDLGQYFPVCEDIKPSPGDAMFNIKNRRYARCVGMTECNVAADFDFLDRCQACLDEFPFRSCTDGANAGMACTLNIQCPGGDCESCLGDDDENCVRGACVRAARRSRDKKINADTDIVLHARAENPPALYLVDEAGTPDLVEMIFRTGEMRSALIANRDGNNDVGGFDLGEGTCPDGSMCDPDNKCDQGDLDMLDLSTLPDCFADSTPTNVDCLLWSTCLDLNIKFQIGVKNVPFGTGMRPELEFNLIGIVDPPADSPLPDVGEQCGGSFEIPDLDFLNTEALRNDARKGVERSFCEDTPPFQACAVDFDGTVEFLNPRLFTVSNCATDAVCDTDFADYLVITGDLRAVGLGLFAADQICEKIEQMISENSGECKGPEGDDTEEREKICE